MPLASTAAACGFPSPADDYMDRPLDFNELLVKNPAATFAVRISGESMRDKGLYPGDIAVVDRARPAVSGCIVLGLVGGEFTIKTYRLRAGACSHCKPRLREPNFPNAREIAGKLVGHGTLKSEAAIERCAAAVACADFPSSLDQGNFIGVQGTHRGK